MVHQEHLADAIYIISTSLEQAEAIRASIHLRGFDRVKCHPLEHASSVIQDHHPDLIIVDPGERYSEAIAFLQTVKQAFPRPIPVILLANAFDEDTFLNCFDAGARDFLVKPVNPSYLVSRVLNALDSQRLQEQLNQRDTVLKEMGVIGWESNVFTTEHLVKMLKREVERLSRDNTPMLSLLVVQLEGFDTRLAVDPDFKRLLYQRISSQVLKACRGADVVGEYFEDKFAVILPNTGLDGAQSVSDRLLSNLDGSSILYEGSSVPIRICIGAADFKGCLHYEDLMNKATENLRFARNEGKKLQLT